VPANIHGQLARFRRSAHPPITAVKGSSKRRRLGGVPYWDVEWDGCFDNCIFTTAPH
jgi:hypothetical protein